MRASRGLKWESKMYKLKRSIDRTSKGRITYNAHAQYFDQCSTKQENCKTACQNLFPSLLIGVRCVCYLYIQII